MKFSLKDIKITTKMTGLSLCILLLVAGVMGYVATSGLQKQGGKTKEAFSEWFRQELASIRQILEEDHKVRLQDLVHAASGMLADLQAEFERGKMTLREAQQLGIRRLEAMRFSNGNGFFFIITADTLHPVTVAHPEIPELEGKSIGEFIAEKEIAFADSTEAPSYVEIAKTVLASPSGDGFVDYHWPSPFNPEEWVRKTTYVYLFEPWGWIIGSGVSMDDIDMIASFKEIELDVMLSNFSTQTEEETSRARRSIIYVVIVIGAIGTLITILVVRHLSKPLHHLVDAADNLAQGNLDYQLPPVQYHDEVGKLSIAFQKMIGSLNDHIARLKETTIAKERIESELHIAHNIQMSIIPRIFPPFPDRKEFDIYAFLTPAKEVGGDYYDFFFIDEDHLCFTVGDVSGKGVPASLYMAVTRTLIRAKTIHGLRPDEIISRVNQDLCMDNTSALFVTIFLGIVDINTGEVEYCNAGHDKPFVIKGDGSVAIRGKSDGLVVGMFEDFEYKTNSFFLEPGETMFLYTDGVTEAMDRDDNLFGDERIAEALTGLNQQTPKDVIDYMLSEVKEFAAGVDQSDDITMLSLRYIGRDNRQADEVAAEAKELVDTHA